MYRDVATSATGLTVQLDTPFRSAGIPPPRDASLCRDEIDKGLRDSLGAAAGTLLTAQAAVVDGPAWDVSQSASPGGRTVVLSAIQWDDAVDEHVVMPSDSGRNRPTTSSPSTQGPIGTATGAELMADGITVVQSPDTAAHLLILRRQ